MTGAHGSGAERRPSDLLVGRAVERAAIDVLLDDARGGVAGALVLAGPPGIGKSALVRYAIDAAAGFRVLHLVGVESEMTFGYAAVHQLVLLLRDGLDALAGPQRASLEAILGHVEAPVEPFSVGLAVLSLAEHASLSSPLLAVIDDAHWVDDESAIALSFVGRRLHTERIASLLAMRDTPDAPGRFSDVRRLSVGGLSVIEARELLWARAGGQVDEIVANRLVTAAEGNPLVLAELPAVLTAEQLRGTSLLPDPLPIGERFAGLFAARLRDLDDDARTLLLLASAERFGEPWLLRRAAGAIGVVSWDDAVASAQASGLVAFTPRVEFRHPLVRSSVYYTAHPSDRRRVHAALAAVLDADVDADRRAWHLGAAASGPDEDVARALEASAERARRRGGAAAAAFFLWRAADLTPDRERAAERLLEAARAELVGGRGARAHELLAQARASGGLSERYRAEATWTEALIHIVEGDTRHAARLMPDALPLIDADHSELAAGACVAAIAAALTGGHLIDAPIRDVIAGGVKAVVERCEVPDPVARMVLGLADSARADHVASIATVRPAVAAAIADPAHLQADAGRGVHVVYYDTTLAAIETLDERAWAELAEEWTLLARRTGALASLPHALSFRSWLDVLQGRLRSAESHLAELEDLISLTGSRGLLGAPAPAHVLLQAWRGNDEATRTDVRRMMQDAHERGHGLAIDHGYAALATLEIGAGRYDAALRAGRRVLDHDSIVGTVALADLVESAVRCGDTQTADSALARLTERAAAAQTPWAVGLLARAQALVAHGDRADERFRTALDALSATTVATDVARTQLLYGEWLRRARRRKDARAPLHDALEFFETIGSPDFADRARSELAATGEHVRSRSAPVDLLTPKEAQIARLAASGARNHEIAAQLYITTSTVEYHLRKVFVKLGVTTRTQLAQVDLPS